MKRLRLSTLILLVVIAPLRLGMILQELRHRCQRLSSKPPVGP